MPWRRKEPWHHQPWYWHCSGISQSRLEKGYVFRPLTFNVCVSASLYINCYGRPLIRNDIYLVNQMLVSHLIIVFVMWLFRKSCVCFALRFVSTISIQWQILKLFSKLSCCTSFRHLKYTYTMINSKYTYAPTHTFLYLTWINLNPSTGK